MSANSNASLRRILDIPMSLSFAEFEALNNIAAADLAKIDGITDGTAAANKALVLNSSSGITTGITLLTATTLTGTTVNATTLTAGTVTPTAINVPSIVRQTADVVKDDGAAASVLTGLSQTVVAGTYYYRANIPCLSTANGGVKVTLKLTTAVLTSIQNQGKGTTAAGAGASARTTTGTDGATLYGATAAITGVVLEGTMVVGTGGTVALYGEQNASHADESTFYTGSTFELIRIA